MRTNFGRSVNSVLALILANHEVPTVFTIF